jgi:hypothetical protein
MNKKIAIVGVVVIGPEPLIAAHCFGRRGGDSRRAITIPGQRQIQHMHHRRGPNDGDQ